MSYELIGITGSLMIILAFLFKDIVKVRVADTVGAMLFVVYGVLIHSFSTVFLNLVLIGVQVVQLAKLKKSRS